MSKIEEKALKLDRNRVEALLRNQLPQHNLWPALDGTYFVPEHNHFERVIRETTVEQAEYVAERYDCENYAMYFQAVLGMNYGINACGMALSYASGHAFNIVLTHHGENSLTVYKFEPQKDDLWTPEDPERDGYVVSGQYILI